MLCPYCKETELVVSLLFICPRCKLAMTYLELLIAMTTNEEEK